MKQLLASWVVLMVWAMPVQAASVNLAWNANPEADLAGYNLYRAPGTCALPGAFAKTNTFVKPAVTGSNSVTVDGDYCYALTAYDVGGLESLFSNKVGVTVNANPPAVPANVHLVDVTP